MKQMGASELQIHADDKRKKNPKIKYKNQKTKLETHKSKAGRTTPSTGLGQGEALASQCLSHPVCRRLCGPQQGGQYHSPRANVQPRSSGKAGGRKKPGSLSPAINVTVQELR